MIRRAYVQVSPERLVAVKAVCEPCGWTWTPNPTSPRREHQEALAATRSHNLETHQ